MKLTSVNESSAKRHKLWDKALIVEDFKRLSHIKLVDYCRQYGGEDHWRTYYNDIWKWRKLDKDFDQSVRDYLDKTNPRKGGHAGGRPEKDGGDKSWQDEFCLALVACNGNRPKAAQVTPYSWEELYEMLDPDYTSFNEEFSKKVKAVELELAARAEEIMVEALHEDNWKTVGDAKITQAKVWVAKTVAEKLDPKRWGKHVELLHKGGIEHRHVIGSSQADTIARLKDEQEAFLQVKRGEPQKALPAPPIELEYIDAEEVEVVSMDPVDTERV